MNNWVEDTELLVFSFLRDVKYSFGWLPSTCHVTDDPYPISLAKPLQYFSLRVNHNMHCHIKSYSYLINLHHLILQSLSELSSTKCFKLLKHKSNILFVPLWPSELCKLFLPQKHVLTFKNPLKLCCQINSLKTKHFSVCCGWSNRGWGARP